MEPITTNTILKQLEQIEARENIRILYACESGSRALGLASAESDYDVRFVYVRKAEWYLSVYEGRDVIEERINPQLDINGWDLRKALQLFRNSNPQLLEWLYSPAMYMEKYSITERIRRLSPAAFSPRSCMFHYLRMAKRNFQDYLQGDIVKIKKYFYVLRPILACMWIEQMGSMPPIKFNVLVEAILPPGDPVREEILQLITRKISGVELELEPKQRAVHSFLNAKIAYFEQAASKAETGIEIDKEDLNILFQDALREAWREFF